MDGGVPPFLTVEEAGRLLRIGRTKAYELTREWRATGGRSGLPVIDLGDVLRVPGPAIERMLGTGLDSPPLTAATTRRRTSISPSDASYTESCDARPASDTTRETVTASKEPGPAERPCRSRRPSRKGSQPVEQLPLFPSTEPTSPHPEAPLPTATNQPANTPPPNPHS